MAEGAVFMGAGVLIGQRKSWREYYRGESDDDGEIVFSDDSNNSGGVMTYNTDGTTISMDWTPPQMKPSVTDLDDDVPIADRLARLRGSEGLVRVSDGDSEPVLPDVIVQQAATASTAAGLSRKPPKYFLGDDGVMYHDGVPQ